MKRSLTVFIFFLVSALPAFSQTRIAFDINTTSQEFTDSIYRAFVDLSDDYPDVIVSDVSRAFIVISITALDLDGLIVFSVAASKKEGDQLIFVYNTLKIGTSIENTVKETLNWVVK